MNPLSWYRDLHSNEKREEYGCFLIEGYRHVQQIMLHNPHCIIEILKTPTISLPAHYVCPVSTLTTKQFQKISLQKSPQGIIAVATIPPFTYSNKIPLPCQKPLLILEGVQDPGNVGTLIRTAAAFGFAGMVLDVLCADPFSPKVVQASAGALFSLWIRKLHNFYDELEILVNNGYLLIAADVAGTTTLPVFDFKKCAVILGNEGHGVSEKVLHMSQCHFRIKIDPVAVQSLNVAVAGALCMYAVIGNKV